MQWLQLILALSILVVIHELGHFCFARLFKTRVEKFYMFFNPQFSIFRAKKINGKWQIKFFAPNVPAASLPVIDALGNEKKDDKNAEITTATGAVKALSGLLSGSSGDKKTEETDQSEIISSVSTLLNLFK